MLSCKEVTKQADQLLDGSLSLRQRFAMRFHLFICRDCRRYLSQLKALLGAIPFMHSKASDEEVNKVMDCIDNHHRKP